MARLGCFPLHCWSTFAYKVNAFRVNSFVFWLKKLQVNIEKKSGENQAHFGIRKAVIDITSGSIGWKIRLSGCGTCFLPRQLQGQVNQNRFDAIVKLGVAQKA